MLSFAWIQLGIEKLRLSTIHLKKAHKDCLQTWQSHDCDKLAKNKILEADFNVPDAASRINLKSDFETKSISASMGLYAPKQRSTAKGRINWLLQQLKKTDNKDIIIKVSWPGRAPETFATLGKVEKEGPEILMQSDSKSLPTAFVIVLNKDLGGRFNGTRTFVQEIEPLVYEFYSQVGQNLKEWVAPPPKMKKDKLDEVEEINQPEA